MPAIAITIGDINGIGPEVILKALNNFSLPENIEIILVSPEEVLETVSKQINVPVAVNIKIIEPYNIKSDIKIQYSLPTFFSGEVAYKSFETAINMAKMSQIDAIVTAPISKHALHLAGYEYSGHTEILQAFYPESNAQMLFASDDLMLLLLTRHIPIKDVSKAITRELIVDNILELQRYIKIDYGISNPKLAILALNPHSGESGRIGNEEIEVIIPAIEELKEKAVNIKGPFSPDGFWLSASNYDCVIAMYHDQGLIPIKLMCKANLTNVTLGLPVVRTSPCHGTAYDIAGKNIADPVSMYKSIIDAYNIVLNRIKP